MKKIIVLGGGTAGWLTALFLQKAYKDIDVSVVEDPKRPPIIAGESGTSTVPPLFKFLDIDLNDWISKVNATPKMGGKFTDWNGIGTEFIHPLQTRILLDDMPGHITPQVLELNSATSILKMMDSFASEEQYLRCLIANDIPIIDAFYSGKFLKEQRVPLGVKEHPITIGCMWHFESRDTAAYLKATGLSRGIKLIEGEYSHANQLENGDIEKITLTDSREFDADWFFDCSGFARLLLGKVLKEPIEDWTDYFPARAVIAWWDKPEYQVTTNARAMKYGWSWNINLIHRSGNGYLYDPDHLSEDQALEEIHTRFGNHIEPVAKISFTPGMMRKCFKNNVMAIGLSSGFMEPLEANGIAVIYEALGRLYQNWNPLKTDQETKDLINDLIWSGTIDIRDFLSLHYRGNREDTDFWRSHRYDKKRVPDSLAEKLEIWENYYSHNSKQNIVQGYSSGAWLCVIQGLNMFPTDKLKERWLDWKPIALQQLQKNSDIYEKNVKMYPTVHEWIQGKTNA